MHDVILNTTALPHLLTLLIALPLAGVAMMPFFKDEISAKHIAFWTAGVEFVLSLPLYLWFDPARHQMQFGEVVPWITMPPISYAVGIDGISLWLVLLTTLLLAGGGALASRRGPVRMPPAMAAALARGGAPGRCPAAGRSS